jgi:hypothetical protein
MMQPVDRRHTGSGLEFAMGSHEKWLAGSQEKAFPEFEQAGIHAGRDLFADTLIGMPWDDYQNKLSSMNEIYGTALIQRGYREAYNDHYPLPSLVTAAEPEADEPDEAGPSNR